VRGQWNQVGILVGTLGGILALMGFFPSLTGFEASGGFGIVQILTIITGFTLMMFGAFIYVQSVYYPGRPHTLWQQIGVRLSLTGLLIAGAAGLADALGYGSNQPAFGEARPTVGIYQFLGMVGGFFIAALGILVFAMSGRREDFEGSESESADTAI
jgi:uncharacterized membrane protein